MNKKITALVVGAGLFLGANNVALAAPATKAVTTKTTKTVVTTKVKTVANPMNEAWDLMNNAKSYNYVFTMPMVIKAQNEKDAKIEIVKMDMGIKGAVDGQYTKNQKQDLGITYKIKSDSLKSELGIDSLNIAVDMKTIGDDYYVRLVDYPAIVNMIADVSALKGKWIKISSSDIESFFKQMIASSGEEKNVNTDLMMANLKLEKQIANQKKVTSVIKNSKAFVITKALPNAKIDNVNSKRWQFTVNKMELAKLMIELNKMSGVEMTKEEITEMNNGLKAWNISGGELAIGAKKELVNIKLNIVNNNVDGDVKTKDSMSIGFNWLVKNFNNKNIKISTPANSISVNDVAGMVKLNNE